MLIADTSGLLAFFDDTDPHYGDVTDVMDGEVGPVVVSPYVIAELDYLATKRWGVRRELAILGELGAGAWKLACLNGGDLQGCTDLVERYSDQRIGLTDASIVVLAERYKTDRILTLDMRHFSVLRQRDGRPFTVLPRRAPPTMSTEGTRATSTSTDL
jgi:predicted nucleic acid-binding protein